MIAKSSRRRDTLEREDHDECRQIGAAHARYDAPSGHHYRRRNLQHELRERALVARSNPLQDEAQHEHRDVEARQRVDDEEQRQLHRVPGWRAAALMSRGRTIARRGGR